MSYAALQGPEDVAADAAAMIDQIVTTLPRAESYSTTKLKRAWSAALTLATELSNAIQAEALRASNFVASDSLLRIGNALSSRAMRFSLTYSAAMREATQAGRTVTAAPRFKDDLVGLLIEIKTAGETIEVLAEMKPWWLAWFGGDWLIGWLNELYAAVRAFVTGLDQYFLAPLRSSFNTMFWITVAALGVWAYQSGSRRR